MAVLGQLMWYWHESECIEKGHLKAARLWLTSCKYLKHTISINMGENPFHSKSGGTDSMLFFSCLFLYFSLFPHSSISVSRLRWRTGTKLEDLHWCHGLTRVSLVFKRGLNQVVDWAFFPVLALQLEEEHHLPYPLLGCAPASARGTSGYKFLLWKVGRWPLGINAQVCKVCPTTDLVMRKGFASPV